jgi:hypothetical protein
MDENSLYRRVGGFACGVLTIVFFLTLSQVGGCTGAQLIRATSQVADMTSQFAGMPNGGEMATASLRCKILLTLSVLALILAGAGALFHLSGNHRCAGYCGAGCLASFAGAFLLLEASLSDLEFGAFLTAAVAGTGTFLGFRGESYAPSPQKQYVYSQDDWLPGEREALKERRVPRREEVEWIVPQGSRKSQEE